jgi:hypothetical protein
MKVTAVPAGTAVTWGTRGSGVPQRDLTPAHYLR